MTAGDARVVLIGAGGHARSVLAALEGGALTPVACTDPSAALSGRALDGVPIVGDDDQLSVLLADGVASAVVGIGATGDNAPRTRVHELACSIGFALPVVRAASATVAGTAELGDGTVVLAGAIVGAGARCGRNVIVNTGAIVEHDCVVGDHAHVASGAVLGGGVRVGDAAHVGLGATIREGVSVGEGAIVGAGAVVIADVAAGTTVVGVPARELVRG